MVATRGNRDAARSRGAEQDAGAYNYAQYLAESRDMVQYWAAYIVVVGEVNE